MKASVVTLSTGQKATVEVLVMGADPEDRATGDLIQRILDELGPVAAEQAATEILQGIDRIITNA